MNILVTGSRGQLGTELRKISTTEQTHNWFFTDVDELDISKSEALNHFFTNNAIELCFNCAAYTAVDKAEDEPGLANLINAQAVANLADACLLTQALLIHVSTDYVFDGENFKPYIESDPIKAVSAYALSKAMGEQLLGKHQADSVIVRTSWLYAASGNNFVKTMMRLGAERDELKVVADQIGTPTWSADLAHALWIVAIQAKRPAKEIYHYSNEGVISWYDFAKAIMEIKNLDCKVLPIESKDYPVKTKRPFYSVLNKTKIKNEFQFIIPYWRDSLIKCIAEIDGLKSE
jgi:dTDP-4-dehydrorhamnose reductase